MRPVDQTRFGWPEGDCLMACVASVLEVPLSDLPDLWEATRERADGSWWNALLEAVRARGWQAVYIGPAWLEHTPGGLAPYGYAIAGGPSPREEVVDDDGENAGHAVVALNGDLVHDPHPSRDYLGGPIEDWILLVPPPEVNGP